MVTSLMGSSRCVVLLSGADLCVAAGDPAGVAPAAQHGRPVPAADVRGAAAAPDAADGRAAAAAQPEHRPAAEPTGTHTQTDRQTQHCPATEPTGTHRQTDRQTDRQTQHCPATTDRQRETHSAPPSCRAYTHTHTHTLGSWIVIRGIGCQITRLFLRHRFGLLCYM